MPGNWSGGRLPQWDVQRVEALEGAIKGSLAGATKRCGQLHKYIAAIGTPYRMIILGTKKMAT